MSEVIENLRTEVQDNAAVIQEAVAAIRDLAEQVAAAAEAGDLTAVAALASDLHQSTVSLHDALPAHTDQAPADPAPADVA